MKFYRLLFLLVIFSSSASAKTMLVLGDSLSAAYGMQQQQGWVALLQQRLSEQFFEVDVVNASISGETLSGGLTRLPVLLDRHQPDYIVLELGANDGLRGGNVKVIEKNLRKLMATATESGARVLLLGIRLPPNYGPRYTENFFKLYEQAAREYKTFRVPFLLENVALDPKMMQSDGLHPNVIAQPVLLDTVWPVMEIMLRKP